MEKLITKWFFSSTIIGVDIGDYWWHCDATSRNSPIFLNTIASFETIFFWFQVGWDDISIQDSTRWNRRNQGIVCHFSPLQRFSILVGSGKIISYSLCYWIFRYVSIAFNSQLSYLNFINTHTHAQGLAEVAPDWVWLVG